MHRVLATCSISNSFQTLTACVQRSFRTKSGRLRNLKVMMNGRTATAGIVVIGDEIIKGQVQDSNSYFLCQRLHHLGVDVKAVVTLPDCKKSIGKHVKDYSRDFTFVITTGGIGPTHDDITYEAVAAAFDDEIAINDQLETLYKSYFKEKYTEGHRKLATIPISSQLVGNDEGFPIVNIRNVYILPGVPKFLQLGFASLESLMTDPYHQYRNKTLYLQIDEMSVAQQISEVNELFKDRVDFGSYPEWHNNYYKLKLTLESLHQSDIEDCERKIREMIPSAYFVNYNPRPEQNAMENITSLMQEDKSLEPVIKESLSIFREALQRYELEEICIGFNGGKDCTLLLHLWYAVALEKCKDKLDGQKLQALYIRSKTPFQEMEHFIEQSVSRYDLEMLRLEGSIKEQLAELQKIRPGIKAVLMGTRRCDPHGAHINPFSPTDPSWPEFMRINPILNWTYRDVWTFLRKSSLAYCSLYDIGYTSIGSMENTHPNPALRYTDEKNVSHYKPAYTLVVDSDITERAGRTLSGSNTSSQIK